jgi:Fe-S oxidoreductase
MFRNDYEKLLPEQSAQRLAEHSYEICEFVYGLLENGHEIDSLRTTEDVSLAYHSHCQQRTLGLDEYTTELLDRAGYDVRTSDVECCGMAGSFGYKEEYADVAQEVGEHLQDDLGKVSGERIAASGTSCQTQLDSLYNRPVPHPIELLAPQ